MKTEEKIFEKNTFFDGRETGMNRTMFFCSYKLILKLRRHQ
jgi:hypothetical protein